MMRFPRARSRQYEHTSDEFAGVNSPQTLKPKLKPRLRCRGDAPGARGGVLPPGDRGPRGEVGPGGDATPPAPAPPPPPLPLLRALTPSVVSGGNDGTGPTVAASLRDWLSDTSAGSTSVPPPPRTALVKLPTAGRCWAARTSASRVQAARRNNDVHSSQKS